MSAIRIAELTLGVVLALYVGHILGNLLIAAHCYASALASRWRIRRDVEGKNWKRYLRDR